VVLIERLQSTINTITT